MKKGFLTVLMLLAMATAGWAASAETDTDQFVLGSGDVLEISVWGDQAMIKKVMVRPDGMVSFPLIGDVKAKGLKVEELRQEVQAKVKEYLPDAPVTILLDQLNSTTIFVIGKVNRPGSFVLNGPTTVVQALAMAGGTNPYADDANILVIRWEDGKQVSRTFSYSKLAGGKDLDKNILLKPRDTIVVP